MKIKKNIKPITDLSRFYLSKSFFLVIGIGISLVFCSAVYAVYQTPDNAGSRLTSAGWTKFVENDNNFHSRIIALESDITPINTAVSTTLPNNITLLANNSTVDGLMKCSWNGSWDLSDPNNWGNDMRIMCNGTQVTGICEIGGSSEWSQGGSGTCP